MITKVTKDSFKLYRELFNKAEVYLNGKAAFEKGYDPEDPGDYRAINSLDEYFSYLEELTVGESADGDSSNKYHLFKILPLNEPTFDIDANTRDITVPDVFKKNGVGVQGDQLAETLFFTIDRYFETIDLYRDDIQGIIQWETAAKGKQFETGYSPIAFKDVTIVKDKMVFGWFLNNIITSNPGSVKFSVRFFSTIEETDDQNEEVLKLNFSLSTKTQTITINPAIVYDINSESGLPEVNAYNDLHLVTNRFVDSVNPGGTGSAEEPVFTHPEFGGIFGEDLQPVATIPIYDSKNETIIDRIHVADLNDITNQLTLLTEAEATDAGRISYYWREKRLERENSTRMTPGPSYIKTEDVEVQEGKKYFVKVSINGVNSSYSEAVGLEVGEAFPEGEYYEQYNGITVSQTGDYWVEAKNRHGSAIAIKKSEIIRIPGPETLSVDAPDLEGNFLDEEGNISIKAVGTTPQENDIINYSWVDAKGVKLKEDDVELNAGFDNEGYSQNIGSILEMATIPVEEIAGYDKNIQVVVSAERNGAVTLPITKSFRITGMPQPAEVVPRNALISTNLTNPVDLYVDINAPKVCDMLTYQWFKYTSDEEDSDFLIEGANGEVENGSAKYSIAYGPNAEQGTFYCRVTTEVNGGSTYVDSDHIVVSRA